VRGEAIAEDEGSEAVSREPVGYFTAFEVAGQAEIGASGSTMTAEPLVVPGGAEDGEGGDVVAGRPGGCGASPGQSGWFECSGRRCHCPLWRRWMVGRWGAGEQGGSEGCEKELHGRPPRVRENYRDRE